MIRSTAARALILVSGLVATACADPASAPRRVLQGDAAAVPLAAVIACPPSVPSGYTLVYCFNFTLQPGVWHGFIVQRSDSQPTGVVDGSYSRTVLSNDYLLVSPDNFRRLGVSEIQDGHADSVHAFQAEFNGTEWFDVVRLMLPLSEVPQTVTIAVAKRPLTPAVQAGRLVGQVQTLKASGAISAGIAASLTITLQAAIAQFDAGRPTPAINMLQAFINHVQGLMSGAPPVIDAVTGQQLIDAAQGVIGRASS